MRKLFCFFVFFTVSATLSASDLVLSLDMLNVYALPRHFRTTNQLSHLPSYLNLAGLAELNMSGSAQFSERSLQVILDQIKHQSTIFIIDLREESHGFLNGIAVSWKAPRNWGNKGKTLFEILTQEFCLLRKAFLKKTVWIKASSKLPKMRSFMQLMVLKAETEAILTAKAFVPYLRIPVADYTAPESEQVDRFLAFVHKLPPNGWLHFHCKAGRGRTTTFMAMYDILRNSKQLSLEEILERQYQLGGSNLTNFGEGSDWKIETKKKRIQFIQEFYNYCKQLDQTCSVTWTEYINTLTIRSKL